MPQYTVVVICHTSMQEKRSRARWRQRKKDRAVRIGKGEQEPATSDRMEHAFMIASTLTPLHTLIAPSSLQRLHTGHGHGMHLARSGLGSVRTCVFGKTWLRLPRDESPFNILPTSTQAVPTTD
jgi:hypothetical protein